MGRGPCRGARRRRHRQLGRRPTGDRPRPRGDGRRHPANSTGSTTASNAAHPETKHPETKEAEAPATGATAAALTRQRRARGPCGGEPSHHTTPEAGAGTWPTRPTPNQDQPQGAPPPGPPARALPRCRPGGGSGRSPATVRSRPLGPSLAPRRRAVQVVQVSTWTARRRGALPVLRGRLRTVARGGKVCGGRAPPPARGAARVTAAPRTPRSGQTGRPRGAVVESVRTATDWATAPRRRQRRGA